MDKIAQEIDDFYEHIPCQDRYRILDKIGEGTFSSVYRALDWDHYQYSNQWCKGHLEPQNRLSAGIHSLCGVVALKRIYTTSSPTRIWNEIAILRILRGHPNIVSLITAERHIDNIIVVLPYFEHDDFRSYFDDLGLDDIRYYMRALLSGLAHVHSKKLIHRDIKPSNFLYQRSLKTGVLVDFGLAQSEEDFKENKESKVKQVNDSDTPGYLITDARPSFRANRAGTRGFRAPEVLFKVSHQTVALDVWSVGVILLCILTGRFPFFQSNDDQEALMEISHLFGKDAMLRLARSFSIMD